MRTAYIPVDDPDNDSRKLGVSLREESMTYMRKKNFRPKHAKNSLAD